MIPPDLDRLLQPLDEFEAIRRRAVRLGARLCDLSYANPYEGAAGSARRVLAEALGRDRVLDLQYSPFGGQTVVRRAVADALALSHRLPFAFSDVILTPGAMAALHLALRALAAPGEEVVIPVPCWLDYPLYARYLGLTPVLVPLVTDTFDLDIAAIERAITARTAAILLSHPSNPTGRPYSPERLSQLAATLEAVAGRVGRRVTLIADEAHRDFAAPTGFHGAAPFWPATVTVYSYGKYHFMQGQRIGYVAVSPTHPARADLAAALVRWTRVMGFCTPTALMQAAIPGLQALRHDLTRVAAWRDRLTQGLEDAGYRVVPGSATLFLYVATPEGQPALGFARVLADAGVLVLPAPVFHHEGYFRLSLTGAEHMMEGALTVFRRLAGA